MIDLSGRKNGKLTIVSFSHRQEDGRLVWNVKCDCGVEKKIKQHYLTRKDRPSQSCGCSRSLAEGEAMRNNLFASYKKQAKARSLEFTLSFDEFISLTSQDCFYCGRNPSQVRFIQNNANGSYIYNGIDRRNNNDGYHIANCVPCCKCCNHAKSNYTEAQFILMCNMVAKLHSVKV
jgi:hypothetical protein